MNNSLFALPVLSQHLQYVRMIIDHEALNKQIELSLFHRGNHKQIPNPNFIFESQKSCNYLLFLFSCRIWSRVKEITDMHKV